MLKSLKLKPRLIISDWDETITVKDTIRLVAETAYIFKPDCTPSFDHFQKVYLDSYANYQDSFGKRDTLHREIEFLNGLRSVENSSIDSIVEHKIFQGLTPDQFKSQAPKIVLRPGFIDFLKTSQKLEIPFVILSANWTSIIIIECLRLNGITVDNDKIKVITNELEFKQENGELVTTGEWDKKRVIRISQDKLRIVRELKKEEEEELIYIGDSSNDLLPLLESDIGCAIKDTKLASMLNSLGLIKDNKYHIGTWSDFIQLLLK
ncbi:uncharacterized protein J8A68_005252 [[Candida] subhashii]|uniref:Uncharacterized protein n=1 Tax=[Candida] subhashii TaxID=561895 RepID=A0A8J5QHC9_9ASCO|nr:uncharacterized protein J8A68_005252 [[Candida] subhashii]KAG7661256.1 hypothetical protein J8A68_005252 [[Candida] subhashii]